MFSWKILPLQHEIIKNSIIMQRFMKTLLGRVEREQRIEFMKKIGFQNENDWPENTMKRLFFITNSEAFKL